MTRCSFTFHIVKRSDDLLMTQSSLRTATNKDVSAFNAADGKGSLDHTSDTDTGDQTCGDRVHQAAVRGLAKLQPHLTDNPTDQHAAGSVDSGVDETKTKGVQVGPVGLPCVGYELDTDENVKDGHEAKNDGCDHRFLGNRATASQKPAHAFPGIDGRGGELACRTLDRRDQNTRVGTGVEQEQGDGNANSEDGTDYLGSQHGAG